MLGLVEGFAAGLEVTAGIGHVAVQPELVELVRQVIVVGNRGRIRSLVVNRTHRAGVLVLLEQCVAQFVTHPDHIADRAFQLQFAFNESSAQGIERGVGQLRHHHRVLDHDGNAGLRAQVEFMAIPESQTQR